MFLHTVKGFQILLCNSNNSTSVICLHTFKWLYIYDLHVNSFSVVLFLNELELICLHTIKFCCCLYTTWMNGFNYYNLTIIILFNIIHFLHTVKWLQVLLFNTNYSIQNWLFICTQWNSSQYYYVIQIILWCIQLSSSKYFTLIISFAHSQKVPVIAR